MMEDLTLYKRLKDLENSVKELNKECKDIYKNMIKIAEDVEKMKKRDYNDGK